MQAAGSFMQIKCSLGGAAAIVLTGLRVAKNRQHAIALNARNQAAMLGDDGVKEPAQLGQHVGVVFRLHVRAQRGRARQVGEHQREVAPASQRARANTRIGRFASCQIHAFLFPLELREGLSRTDRPLQVVYPTA